MKTEDLCWEYFGFPDPGFLPAWLPAEGLAKALAERELPFAGKWDFDPIAEKDQIARFDVCSGGQNWCRSFDLKLKALAGRYLNHLKVSDLSADRPSAMWTWDDLLLEAAGGEESAIADPSRGDLSPEWDLTWLIQRRKAIDLLRCALVPYRYDYLSGSAHTGIPSSPAEAVAAALSGMAERQGSGLPGSYVTLICGPDHGWREGSYCCDVTITRKIFAELPEEFDPDGKVYLVMQISGSDGTDESFAGGGPLSPGPNLLTADASGVFAEFDPDGLTDEISPPSRDHTTSGGWRASFCTAFADYTQKFHFKEKDDENIL